MLEEVYGIKVKSILTTVCVYFITVIPGYILLFEKNKIGFFVILLIENIVTYYLFEEIEILELVEEQLNGKWIGLLTLSILFTAIMFVGAMIKYPKVMWIIIITELLYRIIIKIKNKNSLLK